MMIAEPPDISSLFFDGGSSFGAHEIEELTQAVAANARDVRLQINELRDHINAGNGSDRNHAGTFRDGRGRRFWQSARDAGFRNRSPLPDHRHAAGAGVSGNAV